jgi:hypothetical protein
MVNPDTLHDRAGQGYLANRTLAETVPERGAVLRGAAGLNLLLEASSYSCDWVSLDKVNILLVKTNREQ